MNIVIDPEFRDYLGPLDDETRQALEESLLADGCRDSIVVWPLFNEDRFIVLDGHNRKEICERLEIPYHTTQCPEDIQSREQAVAWIVDNQRARRNLTPERLAYLCAKIYQKEREDRGGDRKSDDSKSKSQNETLIQPGNAAERVGKEFGISRATVHRHADWAKRVDAVAAEHGPEAKAEILAGRKRLEAFEPSSLTLPDPDPAPDMESAEVEENMDLERMRKMSDSDCVRHMAKHAVILPGQDCGATHSPIPLPEAVSENFADPEVMRRGDDPVHFALCELARHAADAEAAIKRQPPSGQERPIFQTRIISLIATLQDICDLLDKE